MNASNGVATFSGLSIDKSGSGYTLTATGNGLTSTTSGTFDIIPASASKLAFTTQPTNVIAVIPFGVQPVVIIQDIFGNMVSSSSATISLSITSETGNADATLSGTYTVNAEAGVASFTDLNVDKTGSGYTLTATSDGLTSAVSSSFNVINTLAAPAISRYLLWGLFGIFVTLFILLLLKNQRHKLIGARSGN